MFGFRINPPGPFWFEDLVFFVIDEGCRLPKRAATAVGHIRQSLESAVEKAVDQAASLRRYVVRPQAAPHATPRREVARLDAPETWTLAAEPLAAIGTGTDTAVACHKTAAEQLDALTYVLARMREELRPLMTYARLDDDIVHTLHTTPELETSIEALLELSRKNAATRPKDRMHVAA